MLTIQILLGDITTLPFPVDAMVNAANTKLAGGGGVDGAIHLAAGPELHKACMQLDGCPVGEVKATKAFNLAKRGVKIIIHTVAPNCNVAAQNSRREELLKNCWQNSLALAEQEELKSIAFPSLGTGIYDNPLECSAQIAIKTIKAFSKKAKFLKTVYIVCFSTQDLQVYQKANTAYS